MDQELKELPLFPLESESESAEVSGEVRSPAPESEANDGVEDVTSSASGAEPSAETDSESRGRLVFPRGAAQSTEIPQRIYLSKRIPVSLREWGEPDFVPQRSFWEQCQDGVKRAYLRFKNFGALEVVIILLILGSVIYFLSLAPQRAQPRGWLSIVAE